LKILKILSPFLIVLLAVLAVTFYPKNTSESHGVSSPMLNYHSNCPILLSRLGF